MNTHNHQTTKNASDVPATTGARIDELRKEHNLNLTELGRLLDASCNSIRYWINDEKLPKTSSLIKLSKLFNVSIDYILCLSDEKYLSSGPSNVEPPIESSDSLPSTEEEAASNVQVINLTNEVTKVLSNYFDMLKAKKILPDKKNLPDAIKESGKMIQHFTFKALAGNGITSRDYQVELLPLSESAPIGASFAISVSGENDDSTKPDIERNEIYYVSKTTDLHPGDIGLFCSNSNIFWSVVSLDDNGFIQMISSDPANNSDIIEYNPKSTDIQCLGRIILPEGKRSQLS